MRKRETDLIAALAEGRLEDETEARHLVASSAEAKTEYEAQKKAIEALRGVAAARMSDVERSTLRQQVWTELRGASRSPGTTRWHLRWSTAAAAILVVIGGAAVLNQTLSPELAGSAEQTDLARGQSDGSGEESAALPALGADEGAAAQEDRVAAPTAAPLGDASAFAAAAGEARTGEAFSTYQATSQGDEAEHDDCVVQAGLQAHQVAGLFSPAEGVAYLMAAPEGQIGPDTPISFIDADTCELVHTDG